MKIGVVLEDDRGLEGNVCAHFGQCLNFLIADISPDGKAILESRVVPNRAQHGGGGCVAVDEILQYGITHVIAGGMGMGAQQKFASRGVKIFGFEGPVKDGIAALLANSLGGIEPCQDHGGHGAGCGH
ncbi:MAG: hypothetical protein GX606_06480 [Elusimicrobia bacterium]|nr:hypothetical protein [Elusimicrobiota bacterium]